MPHPDGCPLKVVDRETGQDMRAALVRADGREVEGLAALKGIPWPNRG